MHFHTTTAEMSRFLCSPHTAVELSFVPSKRQYSGNPAALMQISCRAVGYMQCFYCTHDVKATKHTVLPPKGSRVQKSPHVLMAHVFHLAKLIRFCSQTVQSLPHSWSPTLVLWFYHMPLWFFWHIIMPYMLLLHMSFCPRCVFMFPFTHYHCSIESFTFSSNSDWETLILKLGSGGLPPALPPCVYFAASPPRSLSMTPGDDWVCCFHPWCRSDVTPSSTSISPSY